MATIPPPPPGRFDDDAPTDDDEENTVVTPMSKHRWRSGLLCNANGKVKSLEHNLAQVLRHHPDWQGVIAYDQFASRLVARRRPPIASAANSNDFPRAWRDVDTVGTMAWLQSTKKVMIDATSTATENALDQVGELNAFHPVRDYLNSLTWDGTVRLPTWLARYFGAKSTNPEYLADVGKAWLVSAIARIMRPGCQADYMLVLEGEQGVRKSSALRELFSDEWFTDARIALNDEGLKKLQGKWCVEIAELESFRGKAATEIKAFITSRIDNFRASYGRRPQDYPRTCVMAGTTNEREYLIDRTGNRRFWPVDCGTVDIAAIAKDRDMLWAEAFQAYQGGAKWWLEDDGKARGEQRKREVREPWFEIIVDWLKNPTVPDTNGRRRIDPHGFTMADVMLGAINLRAADMGEKQFQTRIGFCLRKLHYTGRQITVDGRRHRAYFTDEQWAAYGRDE